MKHFYLKGIFISWLMTAALFMGVPAASGQPCNAGFDFTTAGSNSLIVFFQNRSSGAYIQSFWDFGDGSFSQVQNPPPHTYPAAGEYFVTLKIYGVSGICDSVTRRVCLGCVFPGDANNDGIVNNKDVLYVGLAYGAIGPVRRNQSPDSLSPSTQWVGPAGPANFPNGPNHSHADCDGNGMINRYDLALIDRNYGQSARKSADSECTDINDIPLYFEVNDSIEAGSWATIRIMLGSPQFPAQDVYGISYAVNYSSELVKPGSAVVEYGHSLFGPFSDIIFLNKATAAGRVETAVSRIDHNAITVSGQIGAINFVMEENLAQKTMLSEILNLSFSDVTLIKNDGATVPVCSWRDSAVVYQKLFTSGIGSAANKGVRIYPNPADEILNFQFPKPGNCRIDVMNIAGKLMISEETDEQELTMNISALPAGVYFVMIRGEKEAEVLKIKILR